MTTSDARERRTQIVTGAFDALRKNGLPHLSYDLIAECAGVTRQLVRYHYPDAEALMKDVCDYLAGLYREALITTAGRLEGPARVDAFLDFYFDMLDGTVKPKDDQVYDAMLSLATASDRIRATLADQYRLIGQVLSHEFSVQYKEIEKQSAEELSWLFVCLMYGHWKMVASLGHNPSHNAVTREAMDRLILSYRVKGSDRAGKVAVWSSALQ